MDRVLQMTSSGLAASSPGRLCIAYAGYQRVVEFLYTSGIGSEAAQGWSAWRTTLPRTLHTVERLVLLQPRG